MLVWQNSSTGSLISQISHTLMAFPYCDLTNCNVVLSGFISNSSRTPHGRTPTLVKRTLSTQRISITTVWFEYFAFSFGDNPSSFIPSNKRVKEERDIKKRKGNMAEVYDYPQSIHRGLKPSIKTVVDITDNVLFQKSTHQTSVQLPKSWQLFFAEIWATQTSDKHNLKSFKARENVRKSPSGGVNGVLSIDARHNNDTLSPHLLKTCDCLYWDQWKFICRDVSFQGLSKLRGITTFPIALARSLNTALTTVVGGIKEEYLSIFLISHTIKTVTKSPFIHVRGEIWRKWIKYCNHREVNIWL